MYMYTSRKSILISLLLLVAVTFTQAQVGVGTTTPHASAKLEVSSTNQGFLPPRMTAAQRTAITTAAAGLLVFQTDASSGYYYYTGSEWFQINAGKVVLKALTVSGSSADNVDVSGIGILFIIQPTWNEINGLSGGVVGQVLHLVVSNSDAFCCEGVILKHQNFLGNQKFYCASDIGVDNNQGVTLVFDGEYWRLLRTPR
jgi:hypothetical protein